MEINNNLCSFNDLPTDVLPNIIKNCSSDLDKVALVCKSWQQAADSKEVRNTIRPLEAMGIKELKKINPNIVDAGVESPLPRCAYRDLAENGGLLFFNPGKVIVKKADGKERKIKLNTLLAISNLFKSPATNLKTGFTKNSWDLALKDKRKEEPPHWVLVDTNVLGVNKSYKDQLRIAKKEDKKAYPERYNHKSLKRINPEQKQIVKMVGIIDLSFGMLMAYANFEERYFVMGSDPNAIKRVRVKDGTKGNSGMNRRLYVGFAPSGLGTYFHSDDAHKHTGFVCARKSY